MSPVFKIITILHLPAFLVVCILAFTVYVFNDTRASLAEMDWLLQAIIWTAISYPIIFIAGLVLARVVHQYFILLPCINLLVVTALLIWVFIISPNQQSSGAKEEMEKRLESASRDFICENGSFFSIKHTGDPGYSLVEYYNLATMKSDTYYEPRIGYIGENGLRISISSSQKEVEPLIQEAISTCKDQSGKSLSEIYSQNTPGD